MALSAKQLVASEKHRENVKKEYYKELLKQFCRKIKTASDLGQRSTILTVPVFLVGFPRYDLTTSVQYMARQLTRLGYMVSLVGPLDIKVQWARIALIDTETEREIEDPNTYLPSLANLKKTANKIRTAK
jgi:hypothetical protein